MQKRLINDKMKEVYKLVESALPKHCRPAFRENTFIAGSSISSLFFDEEPNDYDFYCTKDTTAIILRRAMSELKAFMTESAASYLLGDISIQIIFKEGFIGEPEKVVPKFDFRHTMTYWTLKDKLVMLDGSADAMLGKELIYTGSDHPLSSLLRIRKFIKRGWTINAGEMLKICLELDKMQLQDLVTLKEQLNGVDIAYFAPLIEALEEDPSLAVSDGINHRISELFVESPEKEKRDDYDDDPLDLI